jgi:hypothetical protein
VQDTFDTEAVSDEPDTTLKTEFPLSARERQGKNPSRSDTKDTEEKQEFMLYY